jgi:hypothetical protein
VPLHSIGWLRALLVDVHLCSVGRLAALSVGMPLHSSSVGVELIGGNQSPRRTKGPLNTA